MSIQLSKISISVSRGKFFRGLRTSLNRDVAWLRPNLKFHFLPTQDTREKPASFGQIAENKVFREKLLLPDRRENQQNASHFV
jgi:hypothetical protein